MLTHPIGHPSGLAIVFNNKRQLMRFLDKELDSIIAFCSASIRDVEERVGIKDVHMRTLLAKAFLSS